MLYDCDHRVESRFDLTRKKIDVAQRTEYKVYLAGELFDFKHLAGNALLGEALEERSGGRYGIVLPQDLELPSLESKAIRDVDYLELLDCDAAIFQFDGSDLDSGTVAEFMTAKIADIPSVILRTDLRRSGDRNSRPWNLMCDSFTRTEALVVDAMALYSELSKREGATAIQAIQSVVENLATMLIEKLDTVVASARVLSEGERATVMNLIAKTYDLGNMQQIEKL